MEPPPLTWTVATASSLAPPKTFYTYITCKMFFLKCTSTSTMLVTSHYLQNKFQILSTVLKDLSTFLDHLLSHHFSRNSEWTELLRVPLSPPCFAYALPFEWNVSPHEHLCQASSSFQVSSSNTFSKRQLDASPLCPNRTMWNNYHST